MRIGNSVVAGLAAATLAAGAVPKRPNVVVILSDDHPVSAIGCYGSRHVETPHIDRLAERGMRFENAFCVNSICGPSRSSILTGTYPHVHGMIDNYHKPDNRCVTYPELFKKDGYQTAIFGKTHHGPETNCIKAMDHYMISHGAQYHNPKFEEKGVRGMKRHPGYVTDILTDKAITWLDKRDPERPFLLLVHHPAAHMPFHESDALKDRFAETVFPEPASFNDPAKNGPRSPRPMNITIPDGLMYLQGRKNVWGKYAWEQPPAALSPAEKKSWVYQRLMRAFMACVVSLDENVGRLVDHIEADEQAAANTVILYASDQGFFLGEHGWYDKRFMYEESIRMPLIIIDPRIEGAGVSKAMVLNTDLAPTLLELAGLPSPGKMQGRSLLPLLRGDTTPDWRKSMYYHFHEIRPNSPLPVRRHYGVRTTTHKLIRFYGDHEQWELYDLEDDPHEMKNLAGDPGRDELLQSLKGKLAGLRGQLGDTSGPPLEN